MNTLSREVTRRFFADGETGYAALEQRWSQLVNDPEARKGLGPEHHLFYAILRGKDWRRAFCIQAVDGAWKLNMTNEVKRANGNIHGCGWVRALNRLHSTYWEPHLLQPFGDLLAHDALARARALVPRRGYREIDAGEVGAAYEAPKTEVVGAA